MCAIVPTAFGFSAKMVFVDQLYAQSKMSLIFW